MLQPRRAAPPRRVGLLPRVAPALGLAGGLRRGRGRPVAGGSLPGPGPRWRASGALAGGVPAPPCVPSGPMRASPGRTRNCALQDSGKYSGHLQVKAHRARGGWGGVAVPRAVLLRSDREEGPLKTPRRRRRPGRGPSGGAPASRSTPSGPLHPDGAPSPEISLI